MSAAAERLNIKRAEWDLQNLMIKKSLVTLLRATSGEW